MTNTKKILFGFSVFLLASHSWANTPNDMLIWTKDGNIETFDINDVDSITFSENKLSEPKLYNDWIYPPVLSAPNILRMSYDDLVTVHENNNFANKCFEKLCQDTTQNIIFSPISLNMALGLCANATTDEGVKELSHLLGFSKSNQPLKEINEFYNKIILSLNSPIDSVIFHLANAAWIDNALQIDEDFYNTAAKDYYATIRNLDFANYPNRAKDTINKWAALMTNDCIKELNINITKQTTAVINNACYFKGKWVTSFTKLPDSCGFSTPDSGTIMIDMMSQKNTLGYAKTDDYQAVKVDYGNPKETKASINNQGAYSMIFLLPNEDKSLKSVLPTVQWDSITFENNYMELTLPSYKFYSSLDLTQILLSLGLNQYYNTPKLGGFINQIKQDSYINVFEGGTEAAAVTSFVIFRGVDPEPQIKLNFNRPFAFAIRENNSGLVIFMGKVEHPSNK